jgi:hypothetical protein
MNKHNNIPLNCFNTLITDTAKFATLFMVEVKEPVSEMPFVYVDPITWDYGLEGKQLSCMDCRFYEWNKTLLEMGLTADQMKNLNDLANTRSHMSHRQGFRDGERHAKSMAILYPK